jgi:succinoglycan biosynthesis protein ExoW
MPEIAVIIPFFAREAAVLARTVRTALNQRDVPTPLVIVVDDGSPHPASTELAVLTASEMVNVRVICQANGGPPFARNAGLDAVPDTVAWIALLDADDTWAPDHLARALGALEQGYDFYFTNHERTVDGFSHFTHCGFDPSTHPSLPGDGTLHAFVGNFFTRNLTRTPVGTSTVVYRRSELGALRFPLFPWTWEDLMFWLEVASRTKRIVFDASIQVRYDSGGIAGADGWRSPAELRRKLWYIQHFANVRKRFRLTVEQAAIVDEAVRQHTEGFVMATLALIRHGTLPDRRVVWDFIRWHPGSIAVLFSVAGRRIAQSIIDRNKILRST